MAQFIKTPAEIAAMREGGRILAIVLAMVSREAKSGVTTAQIDAIAHHEVISLGAKPAFLGYQGFPATLCISINEEIVHGIPGTRVLEDGDVVKLDLGVAYKNLITDAAVTVVIGDKVAPSIQKLLDVTQRALSAGIAAASAGNRVGDIGAAIEGCLDHANLSIIEELCGHGVGYSVHEDPSVPNYGRAGTGMRLQEGMTLAIEPMAALGGKDVTLAADGWTYFTEDRSIAAQFEHTVVVTATGGEILTK